MLKQFNLAKKMFEDPVLIENEESGIEYSTYGEGWYPVTTEDELRAISASITGGGEVWLEKGKLKTSGKAPSPYHKWQNKKWIIDPEQQQAVISAEKSAKRDQINRKRDEVCFGGIYIDTLDKWFDTDETSFVKMIGAKSVMDDDFANGQEIKSELWICADNSIVQLGRDELALIIRSIKQNVSNMHAVAVQHKMQLEQAENPADYDFSAGWSKTYQEFLNEQTQ